jgi:hypothetical protein
MPAVLLPAGLWLPGAAAVAAAAADTALLGLEPAAALLCAALLALGKRRPETSHTCSTEHNGISQHLIKEHPHHAAGMHPETADAKPPGTDFGFSVLLVGLLIHACRHKCSKRAS